MRGLIALVLLTLVGIAHGDTDSESIVRATLSNGLRVIIVRNTLAPVVATSVNYLTGSNETPPGFPGTAHAQEHMMFRGSRGLTADQLADIGSVMGGNFNANTRESLTQYLFTVPAEDLDVALHVEAVRMQDVLDSAADWQQERGAIEQEVAQDLSNPSYILYSKVRSAMFAGTPYANDALGTRPSFERTTAAMLKKFHDTWYAPNNAILVVVGDVDPQATLVEVKQLFGSIKPKKLPPRPQIRLQPPRAASFTVDTDRPNGTLMIAMRVPGLDSPDFPALEVLSDVLSNHRFDLYGLVPQGKALDAEFLLDPLPKAGIAYASVAFLAGEDPKTRESEVRSILTGVAKEGVPAELVDAAKVQERSAAQFQKNSIGELASIWSDAVALYGLNSPDEDLARIEKVTADDVNRVARKYLDLDHAVTAVMLPRGSGKPVTASAGFGGRESISLGEARPTKLPAWAERALKRVTVPPSTLHPVVSALPNGLTLIVQSEDVLRIREFLNNQNISDVAELIYEFPDNETQDKCTLASTITVTLKPPGSQGAPFRKGKKILRLEAAGATDHATTDRDHMRLTCEPEGNGLYSPRELYDGTFDRIRQEVFAQSCALSGCHDSQSHKGNMTLYPAVAYSQIVGVTPMNSAAAVAGWKRILPGDSVQSYLYRKVTCDLPDLTYGACMPFQRPAISQHLQDIIRLWIVGDGPCGTAPDVGCWVAGTDQ